ncbi:MAG: ABC transporter permease, partial [Gemmatimonadota bacterium]|nr:ABC transporter permease [Gemmatimonadota bacterium]
HLEMQAAQHIARGASADEARSRAAREFGGVALHKESARDARGISLADDLARDTRFATRVLRRSPGFTAVAIVTLALGIGATTATFSVANGVLLRPLPFAESERLTELFERTDQHTRCTCTLARGSGHLWRAVA